MKRIFLTMAGLMIAGAAIAQPAPEAPAAPTAPAAAEAAAPVAAPEAPAAPIQTAMASDGVSLVDGKWIKDGRPATKSEIKAHKRWMAENGQSTTGTPN